MIEGEYFFGDHLRWNLWFTNPNPAGAFVATLLPWCWALVMIARRVPSRSARIPLLVVFFGLELGVWYVLSKTYSRGALVSASAGGLCFFLWWLWQRGGRGWLSFLKIAGIRLVAIGVILWLTGFFDRVTPDYVANDRSALNRLVLWQGGLQMIAAAPWSGWGIDQSGVNFSQWYQPLDRDEMYAGMVNSYLHVSVERGLPVLVTLLLVFLLVIIWGLLSSRQLSQNAARISGSLLLWGACFSLVVFLVANVFSTLWIFPSLWWIPGVSTLILIVLILVLNRRRWWSFQRAFLTSLLLSAVFGATLYGTGRVFQKRSNPLHVTRVSNGVWISNSSSKTAMAFSLVPDEEVLGPLYGKAFRDLLHEASTPLRLFIADPGGDPIPPESLDDLHLVFFGHRCEEAFAQPSPAVTLFHPSRRPDLSMVADQSVQVILPSLDRGSTLRRWRRLSEKQGWSFILNEGVGKDARPTWPTAFWQTVIDG